MYCRRVFVPSLRLHLSADFVADEFSEMGTANGSFLVVGTVSVVVMMVVVIVVVGAAVVVIVVGELVDSLTVVSLSLTMSIRSSILSTSLTLVFRMSSIVSTSSLLTTVVIFSPFS